MKNYSVWIKTEIEEKSLIPDAEIEYLTINNFSPLNDVKCYYVFDNDETGKDRFLNNDLWFKLNHLHMDKYEYKENFDTLEECYQWIQMDILLR